MTTSSPCLVVMFDFDIYWDQSNCCDDCFPGELLASYNDCYSDDTSDLTISLKKTSAGLIVTTPECNNRTVDIVDFANERKMGDDCAGMWTDPVTSITLTVINIPNDDIAFYYYTDNMSEFNNLQTSLSL